jgi:flagellar M-ring protein FliF
MAEAAKLLGQLAPFAGSGRWPMIMLLGLAVLVPGLGLVAYQWTAEPDYVPLFASLTAEDAGAIVNQLKAAKTPYRIAGTGDQILVPADKQSELRLRMASQGLPLGGGVGFEVFDKPAFGVSDFAQRLNYQRALQGELARTIGGLREVARARVHLVLPQPSLFTDHERPASASVFLKLQPGAALSREQIRGIVHLVSSSVEGLGADRVTVVDTAGRVLAVAGDNAPAGGALSARQHELKSSVEETLERRVQSLLEATLGAGQAVARVSAQLNLDRVERTEERFDPNTVARQKTRSTESTKGRSSTPAPPAGAPDPEAQTREATTANDGSRESESITYEVSRVLAKTVVAPGDVRRISVAVMLNTPTRVTRGADGKETREPGTRAPAEIETIRKVVMSAVGFDEERGDEVTVVELPFDTSAVERERESLEQPAPPAAPPAATSRWILPLAVAVAVLFVVVAALAGWLGVRQRARRKALEELTRSLEEAPAEGAAPAPRTAPLPAARHTPRTAQPLVPEELMELTREREDIRQKALTMATAEPDATAQLLRAWLVKKKQLAAARGGLDAS